MKTRKFEKYEKIKARINKRAKEREARMRDSDEMFIMGLSMILMAIISQDK
jgi:hypothetical protein